MFGAEGGHDARTVGGAGKDPVFILASPCGADAEISQFRRKGGFSCPRTLLPCPEFSWLGGWILPSGAALLI